MSRSRNWCFTLNNYTSSEFDEILLTGCNYIVVGKEVGEQGTPHLQGFISFSNAMRLSSVKKIHKTAHWEIAKGSPQQNRDYCIKEGDFTEVGTIPMDQKAKGDSEKDRWAHIIKLSEAGDFDTLKSEYPEVYGPKLRCLEAINKKRPRDLSIIDGDMEHEWIVGQTGCGKTRSATDRYPDAYIKEPTSIWWDGYNGEQVVIIDDFDKFQVKQGGDMKRWLDRYPFQAQFKGGMEKIRPRKVIVTSQYHPHEIWDDEKTVDAIMRRVTVTDMPLGDSFVTTIPTVLGCSFVNSFKPINS
uniref:ATP-dependent helicase Rep n=1 Tax=Antarctic circular DNA molecule TaxID=2664238 RepID=A0A5Q2EYW5_9ZZZZ|nr:replication associated protein [Antarctic circular DNA molecule]